MYINPARDSRRRRRLIPGPAIRNNRALGGQFDSRAVFEFLEANWLVGARWAAAKGPARILSQLVNPWGGLKSAARAVTVRHVRYQGIPDIDPAAARVRL